MSVRRTENSSKGVCRPGARPAGCWDGRCDGTIRTHRGRLIHAHGARRRHRGSLDWICLRRLVLLLGYLLRLLLLLVYLLLLLLLLLFSLSCYACYSSSSSRRLILLLLLILLLVARLRARHGRVAVHLLVALLCPALSYPVLLAESRRCAMLV